MKKKINKTEGILFWITGVSGSGKSTFAKKIINNVRKKFGPRIVLHGDQLRKIFGMNGYSREERLNNGKIYIDFIRLIIKQKINIVFAVMGLFDELRTINKKKFINYAEIYIKTDLKKVIRLSNKKFYNTKSKHVVGVDIKPEFPRKPDIIIKNTFNNNIDNLVEKLNKEIEMLFFKN